MAVQPGLCGTWLETPKTGFLRTRLVCNYAPNFEKVGDILVSACPYVRIHVRDIVLKLHVWIPHGKIADAYFWLYPRHLCRRVYSFRLSFCPFVCSLVRSFVLPSRSWNLRQSFASKFLMWCISQQLLIRKHSYLDHSYPGGLAFTPLPWTPGSMTRGKGPEVKI